MLLLEFPPLRGNYCAAIVSSVRETVRQTVRETAVGVFHSYLSCSLLFPLCLSFLPSPPSSSGWVVGTSGDSESLAPSLTGSPFHRAEGALTIIRAVFVPTTCFDSICPSFCPFFVFLHAYSRSNWSI